VTFTDTRAGAPSVWNRVGALLLAFLVGALYGAIATVGHRQVLRIGDIVLPWGLVAALVGVGALLLGIRLVAGGRSASAAAGAGVVVVVALLTLPGPGGSILVVGDLTGTIWTIGPALIAVLVVAWPNLPSARRDDA
jgi:hypothetical protein